MPKPPAGIVFSTEHGEMCPTCAQPIAQCVCKTPIAPPDGDGIARIRLETKGRNGKAVTTIAGIQLPAAELEKLAKDLKRRCSSGGTVKDFVLEIQGDHRDVIERELKARGFTVKRAGG
ncbi:MAG: hypothetical protein RL417_2416 [Pseudomonadota bacterium]|jgi:translation initiation factor 1